MVTCPFWSPTGYSHENNIDLGLVTPFSENVNPNDEYALTAYTDQADGVDDMFSYKVGIVFLENKKILYL